MAGEIATAAREIIDKAAETTRNLFDPDKRMDVRTNKNDIGRSSTLDPDRRIVQPKQKELLGLHELSKAQKSELEKNGMSPKLIEKCQVDSNGKFYLKTFNDSLAGMKHPETNVPFKRKEININGYKIEGTFPVFKNLFTCKLDKENLHGTDETQFKDCMSKLRQEIDRNPFFALKFTPRQLEQIRDPDASRISNLTWHHNEELGKMELVDSKTHDAVAHTGGKSIWGSGNR